MKQGLEYALKRPLTDKEERHINWLRGRDRGTRETFETMFQELYRAGQVDGYNAMKSR